MADQMIIRTSQGNLVDDIQASPVDKYQRKVRLLLILIPSLILVIIALYFVWYFTRDKPMEHADIMEHFKYGSIGSEPGGSLFTPVGGVLPPYLVFKVLPAVCPDRLPGGISCR